VIQHTPNPEHTIACLYDALRPGGTLVLDHYTHNLSHYTKCAPLFRLYLRRLEPDKGIRCTEQLVDIFWPLHRIARRFYPAQILLSRLSPVLCYYRVYPDFSEELHRAWALLDTHDSLTDWHRHFFGLKNRSGGRLNGSDCRIFGAVPGVMVLKHAASGLEIWSNVYQCRLVSDHRSATTSFRS
jgi:SAM-dependent methyltransferase